MAVPRTHRPATAPTDRAAGPGRPKDLAKRDAILEASKKLFVQLGFDAVSMDQIATEAGVSKLTVYSHFGDKESLFAAAVKSHCEQGMPPSLLEDRPEMPVQARLTEIATAFYAMISAPEAIAGHRVLCSPQITSTPLPQMFWESGPRRVQEEFAALLDRRVAAGQLDIPDTRVASSQFFTLLKGEPHARLVFGCGCGTEPGMEAGAHVSACVDVFLRAYGRARG
ncbi:TetR/AcrR family transcriptional regulator [Cognatilysobacter lacus]|uniref:TetR/AcrR family transcriptional regulator n=1 Tax=Cognatilysobacter lacus TaxID=1643323 RepID=A0A5D8YJH8_9GAMM|nr:TetR/AcrR family transcriptional regulator [Lysobacter lacus]TZF82978.1 TetR/AcrR family transcriptional regulator [Lysobacter lacus]